MKTKASVVAAVVILAAMGTIQVLVVNADTSAAPNPVVSAGTHAETQPATAPADADFAELDQKFTHALTGGRWSEASLQFLRRFYDGYKSAHQQGDWGGSGSSIGKLGLSAAKSPSEYIGRYGQTRDGQPSPRPFLSITEDGRGGFFVELEGHHIPTAPWNGAMLFTTGDVVYSQLPHFGAEKPHATLELLAIVKTGDQWVLVSPVRPDQPMPLTKLTDPATQPAGR